MFAGVANTAGVSFGTMSPPDLFPILPLFAATSLASVITPIVTPGKAESSRAAVIPAGSYMREGLLPVPEKLDKKIVKLEFIEM